MSSNVRIDGVRELLNNLDKTSDDVTKATKSANKKAADVFAKQLQQNTPVGKYEKSQWWGKYKAKEEVAVSNTRTDSVSNIDYVAVGYHKDVAWRIHFVEVGTIKMSPRWFITKTVDETAGEIEKVMADEIKKVLK